LPFDGTGKLNPQQTGLRNWIKQEQTVIDLAKPLGKITAFHSP